MKSHEKEYTERKQRNKKINGNKEQRTILIEHIKRNRNETKRSEIK